MINKDRLLKVISVIMMLLMMLSVVSFAENETEGNETPDPEVVETQPVVTEPVTEKPTEVITTKPTTTKPTTTKPETTESTTAQTTTEPAAVASKSSNANLDRLVIKGITDKDFVLDLELSPSFSYDNKAYKIEAPNSIVSIEIDAVAVDRNATVETPEKLDLALGDNLFKIVVKAEDGTRKTYEINVVLLEAEETTEATTVEQTTEAPTIPVIEQKPASSMNTYTKLGIVFGIGGVLLLGISAYLFIKKKDDVKVDGE